MISEEYIKLFNRGAELAKAKKYHEALEQFDKIIEPEPKSDKQKKLVLTGDFLAQAHMRKAWILMDLGRYEEAKDIFASQTVEACLGQLDTEMLYEFFYSYGNCLGQLGLIDEMDSKLTVALNIASEELGDEVRCEMCWHNLMSYAKQHEAYEFLVKESERCLTFCTNNGLGQLWMVAIVQAIESNLAIGKKEKAQEHVKDFIEQATAWNDTKLKEKALELEKRCS